VTFDLSRLDWRTTIRIGLIAGVIALYTSMIGMVQTFSQRSLISGWLTLGQLLLYGAATAAGYYVARHNGERGPFPGRLLAGLLAGALAGLPLLLLIIIYGLVDVRTIFVNVSPVLIRLLTFDDGGPVGGLILVAVMALLGLAGAALSLAPLHWRRPLLIALFTTMVVGLLAELLTQILRPLLGRAVVSYLFTARALQPGAAVGLFAVMAGLMGLWSSQAKQLRGRIAALPQQNQTQLRLGTRALGVFVLLVLPYVLGTYLSEVLGTVGLFILMGLGLNIAVGLAGLLDLGYVANFAIGAYVMGVLTTTGGPGGESLMSFWTALPFSILAAMTAGFFLALPVLRMRGDYLAIATLGFGEITRILALSDWLAPLIGGAQGILFIPKPRIGDFVVRGPQELYYVILAGCALMLFVSWRLNNSRTGRQWMAMREDEDAAAAMGINLVKTKILAFTLSAASGGLAGAIFAAKLSTIFPHSFNLLISINVLSLIIVGGMGSVIGVVIGALALVGLPELLREFAEYRLLLYGAALVFMMLSRPEGLWPSRTRQRELHAVEDELLPAEEPLPPTPGATGYEADIETRPVPKEQTPTAGN
jgi:branched-chain amino acid transport system permease protein